MSVGKRQPLSQPCFFLITVLLYRVMRVYASVFNTVLTMETKILFICLLCKHSST